MQMDDDRRRLDDSSEQDGGTPGMPLPGDFEDWSTFEINGDASLVAAEITDEGGVSHEQIADQQDSMIIVSLVDRHIEVEPGERTTIPVTILNNGPTEAVFRVHVEGWIDENWLVEESLHAVVNPGERTTVQLIVAPPRVSASTAGDYPLAIVVRASEYPGRQAKSGFVLVVLPYDELSLNVRRPTRSALTWFRRSVAFSLTVGNLGNRTVGIRFQGSDPAHLFDFDFLTSSATSVSTLSPGQRTKALVRVTSRQMPVAGLAGRGHVVQFGAGVVGRPELQRWARMHVDVRPLFGPVQMISATGITLAGIFGMLLLILATILVTQLNRAQTVVQAVQSAPPPVIVVNLNQPPPTPPPSSSSVVGSLAGGAETGQMDPSVPLVLPDQVTSPGSGGPFQRSSAEPVAPAVRQVEIPSAARSEMTYAQMFQEIGLRYDLDWRMLAAQAYVESGFDTMALSNAGAMGLMQVLPDTWREFALTAEASDPFDAYSNVLVAAVYLDYLRSFFAAKGYPDKEWMLVAYNWGPDKLSGFLSEGGTWDDMPDARRQYASEILRIAQTLP